MSICSSNYIDEFSNLSVEDLRPSSIRSKENAITPLVNEYVIDHSTSNGSVDNVLFCPFDNNSELLVYQSSEEIGKLSIFSIDFKNNQFKSEFLEDLVVGSKVGKIAWSPDTDVRNRNGQIKLAVTLFNSNEIQIISTFLESNFDRNDESIARDVEVKKLINDDNLMNVNHHINSIEFEPLNGDLLASTGDDKICYVWDTLTGVPCSLFKLTSPGTSVKWHKYEPNKLLVAEKKGIIRFYDVENKSPILSFSCETPLILSADWCRTNNFLIGCSAGPNTVFYNTAQSSYPIDVIKTHTKNGESFAFFDENIYASRGKPNGQILVRHRRNGQELLTREVCGHDLSWHSKYPILAVGAYKKVVIYHLAILS